ncbi:hypothetical protein NA56DRAFT_711807 [Hyaloscypha hepaticicola]|uniref:Uncharacterized protein n=1 Tax=Hyaloscypha hepaticicola TaxID=2082293 RepID=A0A2J6PHU9_9HELO|nr:hypothetical protein NA56DRAFT_711807 [Hyaloscypha hepaticicola]
MRGGLAQAIRKDHQTKCHNTPPSPHSAYLTSQQLGSKQTTSLIHIFEPQPPPDLTTSRSEVELQQPVNVNRAYEAADRPHHHCEYERQGRMTFLFQHQHQHLDIIVSHLSGQLNL